MGNALTHSPAAPTTASPGRAEQTRRAGRGSGSSGGGGGRRQRDAGAGTGSRLPPRRLLHRHHLAPPEEEPRRQEGGPWPLPGEEGRGGRRPGPASAATCEERARRRGCPGLRRGLPTGKGPGLRSSAPSQPPGTQKWVRQPAGVGGCRAGPSRCGGGLLGAVRNEAPALVMDTL